MRFPGIWSLPGRSIFDPIGFSPCSAEETGTTPSGVEAKAGDETKPFSCDFKRHAIKFAGQQCGMYIVVNGFIWILNACWSEYLRAWAGWYCRMFAGQEEKAECPGFPGKLLSSTADCFQWESRRVQVQIGEQKVKKVLVGATSFLVIFNGLAVPWITQLLVVKLVEKLFFQVVLILMDPFLIQTTTKKLVQSSYTFLYFSFSFSLSMPGQLTPIAQLPFAIPKLRRFLGAPYVPMKRKAVEALKMRKLVLGKISGCTVYWIVLV